MTPITDPTLSAADRRLQEQGRQHFLTEAPDLLQAIERGLLELAEGHSVPTVHGLMRAAHTLKGSSASVGLTSIRDLAHQVEDIFRALYDPHAPLDGEVQLLLLQVADGLRLLVEAEITGQGDPMLGEALVDQMAPVLEQLRERLGDAAEAAIPTSVELGFDITQSIFESGVAQRLQDLETAVAGDPDTLQEVLATQAEVFVGLAESLSLPGLAQIASLILQAIERDPAQIEAIAMIALRDLRQSQAQVLAGDRESGGDPSPDLWALAGEDTRLVSSATPERVELIDPSSLWAEDQALSAIESGVDPIDPLESIWGQGSLGDGPLNGLESEAPESEYTKLNSTELEIPEQAIGIPGSGSAMSLSPDQVGDHGMATASVGAAADPAGAGVKPVVAAANVALHESLSRLQALAVLDSLSTEVVAPKATPVPVPDPHPAPPSWPAQIWAAAETAASDTEIPEEPEIQPEDLVLNSDPWAMVAVQAPPLSEPDPITPITLSPRRQDPAPQSDSSPRLRADTVRVDVQLLQQLDTRIGDLLIAQNQQANTGETLLETLRAFQSQLTDHVDQLGQLQPLSDQMWMAETSCLLPTAAQPRSSGQAGLEQTFDPLELDRYTDLQLLLQSLLAQGAELQTLGDTLQQAGSQLLVQLESQNRLLSRVRDDVLTARMVPLEDLFNRFPRMMRELTLTHHKSVDLILRGGHVLIDKGILEKLYDPLLHLLRNAFDHGIEPSELRQQQGKDPKGQIHLSATTQGGQAVIEVRDDGRGLDWQRIHQKAIQKGLLDPRVAPTESDLRDILFTPGFSTAEQVSDLSGRGVGLDVVRSQLEALKGSITVQSQPQQGTTFSLRIPLTLSIAKLLVCEVGSRRFAFWVDAIEQILLPTQPQVLHSGSHRLLRLGQQLIPIRRLDQMLSHHYPLPELLADPPPPGSITPLLLLRHPRTPLAIEVDQLVGEKELVIKPLSSTIAAPAYIYGASVLGDGGLLLVLEGITLVDKALQTHAPTPANPAAPALPAQLDPPAQLPPRILVIDDSVTLRQTLAGQLRQAGLQVTTAEDGQDALDQLRHNADFDGILCDIEMPRLNGFQFLTQVKQDPGLKRIPVWMLTSRQSEKHRRLAQELGATAYLTKPYDPRAILEALGTVISI